MGEVNGGYTTGGSTPGDAPLQAWTPVTAAGRSLRIAQSPGPHEQLSVTRVARCIRYTGECCLVGVCLCMTMPDYAEISRAQLHIPLQSCTVFGQVQT